jgi:hypothetical protein
MLAFLFLKYASYFYLRVGFGGKNSLAITSTGSSSINGSGFGFG